MTRWPFTCNCTYVFFLFCYIVYPEYEINGIYIGWMYNHFAITVTTAQNSGMIGFEWGDQLPRREKTTLTATAMWVVAVLIDNGIKVCVLILGKWHTIPGHTDGPFYLVLAQVCDVACRWYEIRHSRVQCFIKLQRRLYIIKLTGLCKDVFMVYETTPWLEGIWQSNKNRRK